MDRLKESEARETTFTKRQRFIFAATAIAAVSDGCKVQIAQQIPILSPAQQAFQNVRAHPEYYKIEAYTCEKAGDAFVIKAQGENTNVFNPEYLSKKRHAVVIAWHDYMQNKTAASGLLLQQYYTSFASSFEELDRRVGHYEEAIKKYRTAENIYDALASYAVERGLEREAADFFEKKGVMHELAQEIVEMLEGLERKIEDLGVRKMVPEIESTIQRISSDTWETKRQ